jgi:uncharacterized protein with Zn-ribbon domain DUF2116
MDILDQADEAQAAFHRAALSAVPKPVVVHGIGMCLNCDAAIDDDRRWCDAACRDEHQAAQQRAGRG